MKHSSVLLHTPTCIHSPGMVQLNDESSGGPLVVVVRPSPPGIGKWSYPRPWIILTPFTCTEQDGLTSLVQSPRLRERKCMEELHVASPGLLLL